jgi:hypothetical protein
MLKLSIFKFPGKLFNPTKKLIKSYLFIGFLWGVCGGGWELKKFFRIFTKYRIELLWSHFLIEPGLKLCLRNHQNHTIL